jgi:hypothetical protein
MLIMNLILIPYIDVFISNINQVRIHLYIQSKPAFYILMFPIGIILRVGHTLYVWKNYALYMLFSRPILEDLKSL